MFVLQVYFILFLSDQENDDLMLLINFTQLYLYYS